MSRYRNARLETVLSLEWYELALTVLFSFVAKTSEVLIAAGLVVSTANFLTDGSIMSAQPGLSTAWAWAQSISLDSSLAICLSYTFLCLKQHAWIRGIFYGALTLLLSLVAGVITTIDIVSHALHISTNSAMMHLDINVTLLSQLRAIAVVGFLLICRLRTLPVKDPMTQAEPAPQPTSTPVESLAQKEQVQTMIQSLCSQFSREEIAQIINACLAARKITLATLKDIPAPQKQQVALKRQEHDEASMAAHDGTVPGQETAGGSAQTVLEPAPVVELSDKEPVAPEQHMGVEHHTKIVPVSVPEALALQQSGHKTLSQRVPEQDHPAAPEPEAVPPDGTAPSEPAGGTASEETPMEREARLEQAYQSLLAEGKKPSGRALAERAHVHRSTCVEWLRTRHQEDLHQEDMAQENSSPEQYQDGPLTEPDEHLQDQQQEPWIP